jgi:hypothetical protein
MLIYQYFPFFNYKVIALKSRTIVVKSRAAFATKFVHDLSAKLATLGDGGRGRLRRGIKRAWAYASWVPNHSVRDLSTNTP